MIQTRHYKLAELAQADLESIARALTRGAIAVLATDTVYGIGWIPLGGFCVCLKTARLRNRFSCCFPIYKPPLN